MNIPKEDVRALIGRLRDEIRMRRRFGVPLTDMEDIRDELEVAVMHIGESDLRAHAESIRKQFTPRFSLTMLGQPVGKARVRFTLKGQVNTPHKTLTYEGRLASGAEEAMAGRPPFEGPLRVTVEARLTVAASWSRKKRAAALSGVLRPNSPRTSTTSARSFATPLRGWPWHHRRPGCRSANLKLTATRRRLLSRYFRSMIFSSTGL